MPRINIYLSKEESDKLLLLKNKLMITSKEDVIKFLITNYKKEELGL